MFYLKTRRLPHKILKAFFSVLMFALFVQVYYLLKMMSLQSGRHEPLTDVVIQAGQPKFNLDLANDSHNASLKKETIPQKGQPKFNLDLTNDSHNASLKKETIPQEGGGQVRRVYRIQLFDRADIVKRTPHNEKFIRHYRALKGRPLVIKCDNNSVVELTVADEKNGFSGMDAVIFHIEKKFIPTPLPPADMNPNQIWIYFSYEPASKNAQESNVETLKFPINALWTYHRSSQIFSSCGFYNPTVPMTTKTKSPEEWINGKTELVAWMAGNCNSTTWPRFEYVQALKKYIPVDVYGLCGDKVCMPKFSKKCINLHRKYKFYLALESCECEDYISEKFWLKSLLVGTVPIVYGPSRKVYEDLAPPNSFIFIGDYATVEKLADYLKLLDSRPDLYAKYLEWQYQGSVEEGLSHRRYQPAFYCHAIPVIEQFRRGESRRRVPYGETHFATTCRARDQYKTSSRASFNLEKWKPW